MAFDPANVDVELRTAVAPSKRSVATPIDFFGAQKQLTQQQKPQQQQSQSQAPQLTEQPVAQLTRAEQLQQLVDNYIQTSTAVAERATLKSARLAEQARQAEFIINDADKKIQMVKSDPFALFKALFGDDNYNRPLQQKRKAAALESLQTTMQIEKLKSSADKQALAAAKAPLEMLKFVQSIAKGSIDMDVSKMQLLINNQAVQKNALELEQSQITFQQAREILASGEYTAAANEDFLTQKLADYQIMIDDLELSNDAKVAGKYALAERKLNSALKLVSEPDAANLLNFANKQGLTSVLIEGSQVPTHMLSARLDELKTSRFNREKQTADRMVDLQKYATRDTAVVNSAISTAITTIGGNAQALLPDAQVIMGLDEGELAKLNLFDVLPEPVASALYDVSKTRIRLDEQLRTGKASAADLIVYNKQMDVLKEETAKRNKIFVESVSKKRQPAYQRLVNNRMVISDPNQAAQILAETGAQQPNFNGNEALSLGFKQFVAQLGEQKNIQGKDTSGDMTPAQANVKFYDQLMSRMNFGLDFKETDYTEMLRAVNKKPDEGYSVVETILNEQEAKTFQQAAVLLSQEYPEVQQVLFQAGNMPSAVWHDKQGLVSQAQVVGALVNLGQEKHKNANFYVTAFYESVYKAMENSKTQMENFNGLNAQAFMKMVFPFEDFYSLVSTSLISGIDETAKLYMQDAISKPKLEDFDLYNIN